VAERNESGQIRAAGGIVVRPRADGVDVLMVHRRQFGDWTIPRGKAAPRESDEEAALREVEEETGLACELGGEAGVMHYRDRRKRDKLARYWLMVPRSGRFRATGEVDRCEWMDIHAAAVAATRSGERDLLAGIARELRRTAAADGSVRVDVGRLTVVHEEDDEG
jgi:8-oxo-dGTP pyrophosphatase MutT (NUDIX family)